MSAATAFVTSLRSRGATLYAEGDDIRVTPKTALTDADRAAWKMHRAEILQVLASADFANGFAADSTQNRTASTCTLPSTDAERLRREVAGICEVLPDAKHLPDGDWIINGEVYDHDNAVSLAGNVRGTTTNGYPLTFNAGAAHQGEAREMSSMKRVNTEMSQ